MKKLLTLFIIAATSNLPLLAQHLIDGFNYRFEPTATFGSSVINYSHAELVSCEDEKNE